MSLVLEGQVNVILHYNNGDVKRVSFSQPIMIMIDSDYYYLTVNGKYVSVDSGHVILTNDYSEALYFPISCMKVYENHVYWVIRDVNRSKHLYNMGIKSIQMALIANTTNMSNMSNTNYSSPTVITTDNSQTKIVTSSGKIAYVNNETINDVVIPSYTGDQIIALKTLNLKSCENRNAILVDGICVDCLEGEYVDRANNKCLKCPSDAKCGDFTYCSGKTGNADTPCVKGPNGEYTPDCTKTEKCQGLCSGGCGASEVFGWKCKKDSSTGFFACKPTWILALWIIFGIVLLVAMFFFFFWLAKSHRPKAIDEGTNVLSDLIKNVNELFSSPTPIQSTGQMGPPSISSLNQPFPQPVIPQ